MKFRSHSLFAQSAVHGEQVTPHLGEEAAPIELLCSARVPSGYRSRSLYYKLQPGNYDQSLAEQSGGPSFTGKGPALVEDDCLMSYRRPIFVVRLLYYMLYWLMVSGR